MSLTGTRSPDDRRRRRLAGAGDGADVGDLDSGGIRILRERIGDLPSASPWLPRQVWKRNTLLGVFWVLLLGALVALARPLPPHPQIAPAVEHLTQGTRPILSVYADVILWTLAGQFAAIIGWYRSHSTLDFQGRYRVWAWAAVVLTAWGFFAGTSLHTAVATVAGPQLRWPLWRSETVVWLVPAAFAGLSVWWLADKDMQRSRTSLWLVRTSILVLTAAGLGELFARDLSGAKWFPLGLTACHLIGTGLLISGLWFQAWYVAYVSADPPEAREPINWRGHLGTGLGTMWSWLSVLGKLWPFRRRAVAEVKPKRRTAKKKDEDEESEEEAPKRRRKPAAKTKRATKPRTRVKPEPEEEEEEADDTSYEDEEAAEETWEDVDDSSAESEDEWTEEYEEEPPPPPARTPTRAAAPAPAASKPAPPPPAAKSVVASKSQPVQYDSSDEEESDDDAQYRVDDGESGADMFKGMSKRQRRELRKQQKDKERQGR